MSPLLQEIFCYVGQLNVYEKSTAILEKLLGITTNNMQVNKVTDFYGKQCSKNELLWVPVLKGIKKVSMYMLKRMGLCYLPEMLAGRK